MAVPSGLNPNIRLDQPPPQDEGPVRVVIGNDNEGQDQPETDDKGNILRIKHADGDITVSMDGQPVQSNIDANPKGWFDNLVDQIDPMELGLIADDLLRGVGDDITSRQDWIDQRVDGIKLLGLKLETPDTGDSGDGAAVEGMSRIRHPMLLEAVLRFQANSRSEMLPTDGPVKIRDDNNNAGLPEDQLSEALEKDMNHYLTKTATEYYPDTDRMFFGLGFGGMTFKKVYYCPLRNRPVSETVEPDDLIVNNSATDLMNAKRVTHRIDMSPSTVRRMQLLGIYRDIKLSTPNPVDSDALKQEKKDQQGISPDTMRPEDRDREILECCCERNLKGFEHKWKGKESGLEVPYRITIDKSSREILSIVRNYDEDTKKLPEKRMPYVAYVFVPGFGFYAIGLLHILGNATNAVTAAWRELLDMGMFSNFPGFLISKSATRQNSNILRVAPGSGAAVDTNGMAIGDAVMPLPYSAQGMPALMSLVQNIVEAGQRVGSTSEQPVGEGKQDAPVGTTLALIEQAQKILNSVHKRMHAAQAEELQKIAQCFRENPESFWQQNRKPARKWDQETFLKALDDCNLVPQSDPNTASHVQRLMKVAALKQLQAGNQSLYDPIAIDTAALQALGFNNPQQFFAPPSAMAKPPPELQQAQAELALKNKTADTAAMKAQSDAQLNQARAQEIQHKMGLGAAEMTLKKRDSDAKIAKTHLDAALENKSLENATQKDLVAERIQLVDAAQNAMVHGPEALASVTPLIRPAFDDVNRRQAEYDAKKRTPPEEGQ